MSIWDSVPGGANSIVALDCTGVAILSPSGRLDEVWSTEMDIYGRGALVIAVYLRSVDDSRVHALAGVIVRL